MHAVSLFTLLAIALAAPDSAAAQQALAQEPTLHSYCRDWQPEAFDRNPTPAELRCRHGIEGDGRFGLLSYVDVPVYQPATPMPGTHLVGMPGHAGPQRGESYEAWEWRVLRTQYGAEALRVHRELSLLDPLFAERIIVLERRMAAEGVRFTRRETWRSPERQGYLFQQGRSRSGPIATTTLTSWHGQVDVRGNPAGRAVDYLIGQGMQRFHEIANELGLTTFGADSHDPGHVFIPDPDPLPAIEIQLLRLLPRVPEVRLATGLPDDRPLPPGGLAALREAVASFVSTPFLRSYTASTVPMPLEAGPIRTRIVAPPSAVTPAP